MKKIVLILFALLFLVSCSKPVDETDKKQPEVEQEENEETKEDTNDKVYDDDIEWGPLS